MMSTAERTAAKVWQCSNFEYHDDCTRTSNSSKELFRENREDYKAIVVDRTMPKPEPTDQMILGTHIHTAILEPEVFANQATPKPVIVEPIEAPDGKKWRRTKGSDHFKWWAEFEADRDAKLAAWRAENAGKYEISDKHLPIVLAVREAAMANLNIRAIIEETAPAMREHTLTWDCEETGLPLKCRRDIAHERFTCDIKSLGVKLNTRAVANAIADRGYHRQAAFYTMADVAYTGKPKPFVFLFLSTKNYRVGLFDIDPDDLAFAHKQNMETLAAMERCRRDPSQYTPEYAQRIYTVTLPRFSRYEDDYGF